MPNKRDPNKTYIGIFIDKDIKERLQKILKKQGSTITEYFYIKTLELLENEKNEIIEKLREFDGRTSKGKAKRRRK